MKALNFLLLSGFAIFCIGTLMWHGYFGTTLNKTMLLTLAIILSPIAKGIIALVLIGFVLWAIGQYIPNMQPGMRKLLHILLTLVGILIVILAVIWILNLLGIYRI